MIQATVTGNLGKSPELRETKNGKQMCRFSLASTNRGRDGSEPQTTWIDCVAFDDVAEGIAGNLDKGMRVIATGPLAIEKYTRKEGGEGQSLSMIVNDIGLTVRPKRTPQPTSNGRASETPW